MRYFKLILIFILVYASKNFMELRHDISVDTHTKMQQDFELILGDAIITAVPAATEITFEAIRSKIVNEDKIEIDFSTSFIDPSQISIKVILEGQADLNRIYEDDIATKKWSLDSFQLGDEQIEFQKEIVIEVDRSQLQ